MELLSGERPRQILSQPLPAFPKPSTNSKTAFDNTIAPIPSSDSVYNIDEIKSDALWLSKQTDLDELEALRIACLEWQYRPESRLREGLSEAETASLRDALGPNYLDRQIQLQQGSETRDDAVFDGQHGRRARLLLRYFKQQVIVFHIRKILVDTTLLPQEIKTANTKLAQFATDVTRLGPASEVGTTVETFVQAIEAQLERARLASNWDLDELQSWKATRASETSCLQIIAVVIDLLMLSSISSMRCESKSVLTWLNFAVSQSFFTGFTSEFEEQRLAIEHIQLSASLVTITLLSPAAAISTLYSAHSSTPSLRPTDSPEYFFDPDAACDLHRLLIDETVPNAAQAGPAMLAWAVVLQLLKTSAVAAKEGRENHPIQRNIEGVATYDAATGRRGSSGSSVSTQHSIFEDVWEKVSNIHPKDGDDQTDAADLLLDAAVNSYQAFDTIAYLSKHIEPPITALAAYEWQALQELVGESLPFLHYTTDTVNAQLALLSVPPVKPDIPILIDPCLEMLNDDNLRSGFYDASAARFPHEILPFLQFSKALAKSNIFQDGTHYVEFRLRSLETFAQAATEGSYATIREDENADWVILKRPLSLLETPQRQQLLLTTSDLELANSQVIPAQTIGKIISGSPSAIINWQHEYSGLGYLGKFLELYHMKLVFTSETSSESPQDVVSEILSLAATLMSTILAQGSAENSENALEHCNRILNELSIYLNEGTDFTKYVFEVLEQELQSFRRRSVSSFDRRVLISCLEFIVVLTKIRPNQVWSNLNRTSLLGSYAGGGLMIGIISAVEIHSRNFDLLEQCSQLYQALFELARTRSRPEAHGGRRQMTPQPETVILLAQRMQGPTILAFTEIMFTVFQQIQEWEFESRTQFARVNTAIAKCFSDIICSAFNFGSSMGSNLGTTVAFAPAASFLVSAFRPSPTSDIAVGPIVRFLFAAGCGDERDRGLGYGNGPHVKSILSLTILLIRYGMLNNLPLSTTEIHAFNAMPAIARVLQLYPSYQPTCLTLMQSLTRFVDQHRPSSLLGHFGSVSSLEMLHVIKHVDQLHQSSRVREEVWKLLSLLVKSSQQWIATVVLTGAAPHGSRKLEHSEQPIKRLRGKTFLQTAIHELGDITTLSQYVAIAMLEFVLQAQSNWSWVTDNLKSSNGFFEKMIDYVASRSGHCDDELHLALHNSITALVTDLSTTHLHHLKVTQDKTTITTYIPLIRWLCENAVEVSKYNASLHANLRKNFAAKYSGLTVSDLRRTGLIERSYDHNYFYDVEYGSRLFAQDPYWHGGSNRPVGQSFSAEFRRANSNLSLAESEVVLLSSLHQICVEHSKLFMQTPENQLLMTEIVHNCLRANTQVYSLDAIFDTLLQTRADLTLALLRHLLATGAKSSRMSGLLEPAWLVIKRRDESYDHAIVNGDLIYWRSMLYALAMVIQYHGRRKPKPLNLPGTNSALVLFEADDIAFMEIASSVVAEGFKAVVNALQDQKLKTSDKDMDCNKTVDWRDISLLLTIFQAILRLPKLAQFSTELSGRLVSSGMISSCLLLFSWSHILSNPESNDQAGYAELCMQLLVSLSSLPLVAEELAVEGVLSRILTSKTAESLQRVPGGVSHVDQRPNGGMLYRIWAGGLLPLCLNLLYGVGGAIASEISNFLNQFPNQLVRANTSLVFNQSTSKDRTNTLTLLLTSEASTLSLISRILSSYREAGASVAVEPGSILPLTGYDEHRKAIMDDLTELLNAKKEDRLRVTVATSERELGWQKPTSGQSLDAKIVKELRLAFAALRRAEDDEDK